MRSNSASPSLPGISAALSPALGAALLAATVGGVGGCSAKYEAAGPVITGWQRSVDYNKLRKNDVQYFSEPVVPSPIIPVMAFGQAFDLDLVVRTKDDRIGQIEVAKVNTPTGPQWFVLEAEPVNGSQIMVANVAGEIDTMMPELYLYRFNDKTMEVRDKSGQTSIDVSVSYNSQRAGQVELTFQGDPPWKLQRKRNGQTFNVAQDATLTARDLPYADNLFRASVQVNDKKVGLTKMSAVVPFQFVAQGAQGGMAVGSYKLVPGDRVAWENDFGVVNVTDPTAAPPPPPAVAVQTLMARRLVEIRQCYGEALIEAPELQGRVRIDVSLVEGEDPVIELAELDAEDALVDESFSSCVGIELQSWDWPAVTGRARQELLFSLPASEGAEPGMSFESFEFAGDGEDFGAGSGDEGEPMEEGEGPTMEVDNPAEEPAEDAPKMETKNPAEEPSEDAPKMETKNPPEDEGEGSEEEDGGQDMEDLLGEEPPRMGEGDEMGEMPDLSFEVPDPPLAHFSSFHTMPSGKVVEQRWMVARHGDRVTATQSSDMRTITYTYNVWGEALELASVTVEQFQRPVPVTAIHFSPPLPDLRRRFGGRHLHNFVIDVNGQQNHAVGSVEVWWSDAGPNMKVMPDAPDWTTARPMQSKMVLTGTGEVEVITERVE